MDFGIVPLYFKNPKDYDDIQQEDILELHNIRDAIQKSSEITVFNKTRNKSYACEHHMSPRQIQVLLAGGLINTVKGKI